MRYVPKIMMSQIGVDLEDRKLFYELHYVFYLLFISNIRLQAHGIFNGGQLKDTSKRLANLATYLMLFTLRKHVLYHIFFTILILWPFINGSSIF